MEGGKGNGIVFLLGALISVLSNFLSSLFDYAFEAMISGLVLILFRVVGDHIEVWVRHGFQKLREFWRAWNRDEGDSPDERA